MRIPQPGTFVSSAKSLPRCWEKFTVEVLPSVTKAQFIAALSKHGEEIARRAEGLAPTSRRALVVLASGRQATWLEDQKFMTKFVDIVATPKLLEYERLDEKDKPITYMIDVLSGVVDGIGPSISKSGRAAVDGFSVMYGNQRLLPALWDKEEPSPDPTSRHEEAASITFCPPAHSRLDTLEVTMPLANTIFQNGRRSTLFATRYQTGSSGRLTHRMPREKRHQRIQLEKPDALYDLPLVPLGPPRKIVSGLGNIVRQIQIDGVPSPASQELEIIIPQILEEKSRVEEDGGASQGAIGVWAYILPAEYVHEMSKHMHWESLNWRSRNKLMANLVERRFPLHKILSGGGGWGAKKGLLSLDPATSYPPVEQDSIDDFARAFLGEPEDGSSPPGGIVRPGSYILFLAEPPLGVTPADMRDDSFILGVAGKDEQNVVQDVSSGVNHQPLDLLHDSRFSAVSAAGIYVQLKSPTLSSSDVGLNQFRSKIDVPNALITLTKERRPYPNKPSPPKPPKKEVDYSVSWKDQEVPAYNAPWKLRLHKRKFHKEKSERENRIFAENVRREIENRRLLKNIRKNKPE